MYEKPKSRLAPAMIVAGVLLLLVLYVAGYFGLSETDPSASRNELDRVYANKWSAAIYKPGGYVESAFRRQRVNILYFED
jgi:hypothetical protein